MLLDTCSSIHKVEVEIYVELDDVQAGGFNLLMFIPIRMGCYNLNKKQSTTLYLSSLLLQANFFEAVFSDIGTGKQQFHGQMDYKAAGLYTLDEALETVGFGKFQGFVLGYAGLGWFAEAMEIMILSFIGQAIVMPRLNWRWVLAFSAVPSFALLILYGVAPESPRYLCMKGNTSDALRILEKIASVNQTKLPPGVLVSGRSNDKDEESAPSESTAPLLPSLNSFSYYGIILLTSKLSSGQSTCFPSLQSNINPQDDGLYLNAFITSMAELPGLLLSAILVDRVGRKHSMAIMFGLAFIFLTPLLIQQPAVLTTCLLFGARMNAMGTFTVASIYSPELYPTSVRTTGAGVASAIGRIGGMVCPLVAVGLVNECHQTAAVALFLVAIVVSIVCIQLFPYDTKGRELSDTS
ncbi:hypothetical protein GOBAR_DD18472 [Gossypium barbadense]|nr:hypothetical protein GOBAR_DD18472 [Gossypium barbadense]